MVNPGPTTTINTRTLSSFSTERNLLIVHLADKHVQGKVTSVNSAFDSKKIKMENTHVELLLASIEAKFKRCQTLYFTYFESVNHSLLCGDPTSLPLRVLMNIDDATMITEHSFAVNHAGAYKGLIDYNFQNFIITVASLYENLVALCEVFVKKVIVFIKSPQSTPMRDYIMFHKKLMDLGYRSSDHLATCLDSSATFLDRYLPHLTSLRNKFVHGYSLYLEVSGSEYFVNNIDVTFFAPRSTDLLIDMYTREIISKTETFIRELMVALFEMGKDATSHIPA